MQVGELCWLAAVSRPDICASLAHIASRINSIQGVDGYRITDLVKTVKKWQPQQYFSSGRLVQGSLAPRMGGACKRKETSHGNAMTLVGWSGAAHGDQSVMGK